jgi:hypothetical protein
MKIEVIAFYPSVFKKKPSGFIGTMHIRLSDLEIDIRGIRVFQKKTRLFFFMNRGCCRDDSTGKIVHYPIFAFNSLELNKELHETLAIAGRQFIDDFHTLCLLKSPYSP